jgi:hypothetical protein
MQTDRRRATDPLELSRRALVADLGATLGGQPEYRHHVQQVHMDMPEQLAWTIHHRGWIVEPAEPDHALVIARRYGSGPRRRRIVAIFLRQAAAALRFAPPELADPYEWSALMMMNIGDIAYTSLGQDAGVKPRPSSAALDKRERGCQAIAHRGAGRCIVCGAPVPQLPVAGAAIERQHQPFCCVTPRRTPASRCCADDKRFYRDAMKTVFERCEWLLAEAITLPRSVLHG